MLKVITELAYSWCSVSDMEHNRQVPCPKHFFISGYDLPKIVACTDSHKQHCTKKRVCKCEQLAITVVVHICAKHVY